MNKVKVKIYNREYSLQTDETPEYTKSLAKRLDSHIAEMMSGKAAASLVDACVLIALSAYDDCQKANDNIDNIRKQIKDYVDDAGAARLKCDELQKENRHLRVKNEELESKLKAGKTY
ncbi:MAG: cell division protein ZapA [Oscillospiraceae bacterium]|jgi:cell division protein ZapA